jgi:nicotinamidase-related amidase
LIFCELQRFVEVSFKISALPRILPFMPPKHLSAAVLPLRGLDARQSRNGLLSVRRATLPSRWMAAESALLMVDVYRPVQYGEDVEKVPAFLAPELAKRMRALGRLADRARAAGIPVIYVMNSAPRNAGERSRFGQLARRHWGAELNEMFREGGVDEREFHGGRPGPLQVAEGCEPRPGDYYVRKQFYSGFYETRLDSVLRNLGRRTLLVGGIWLNVCVMATLLDALYRNYDPVLLRDGTLAGEDAVEGPAAFPNTERFVRWVETFVGPSTTTTAASRALAASRDGSSTRT